MEQTGFRPDEERNYQGANYGWQATFVVGGVVALSSLGVGSGVGVGVTLAIPAGGKLFEAGVGALAAVLALLAFGVWAYALDRGDLRMVAGRLRRFARSRR